MKNGKYATNDKLRRLMKRQKLKRRDVADILRKPLNCSNGYSNSTIDGWLSDRRVMPQMAFDLIDLRIQASA